MANIHNRKIFLDRRRELRQNSTPEELLLWQCLRGKNLGFKFYRQHSIGNYIVDFYCAEKHLIIELDGEQHKDLIEYDTERSFYLQSLGNKIIRFWNNELRQNLTYILNEIRRNLD